MTTESSGHARAKQHEFRPGEALLRGAFLACSWTWCIGMFLPALLVRDFGWPGWLAFAMPNVVGAALVGLVWRRAGSGERAIARHLGAMRLFSLVTILFHVSFLSWTLAVMLRGPVYVGGGRGVDNHWLAAGMAVALVWVAWSLSSMGTRGWLRTAAGVFTLSLLLAALAWRMSDGEAFALPGIVGAEPATGLVWAFPALIFGFMLCPHLDLTIHRMRIEAPGRTGDVAFVAGFGVLFLAMILLTLGYSTRFLLGWTSAYIMLHIAFQSVFTMGAHLRELRAHGFVATPRSMRDRMGAAGLALLCFGAAASAWVAYTGFERLLYELFLSPYALLFPAYVWIVMMRRRRGVSMRVGVLAVVGVTILAAPLMWLGFVEKQWWALGVAVAIPLAAPLGLGVLRGRDGDHGVESPRGAGAVQ